MQKIVSFSGGRTSAYLVYLTKKLYTDMRFVFMDTGAEHPSTYKFIRDVARHFDIDLVCLRVKYNFELGKGNDYEIISLDSLGENYSPWQGLIKKYGHPSVMAPLKKSTLKKLLEEKS